MSQFEQIAKMKKDYEAAVKAVGKQGIQDLLTPLFEKFPQVRAVQWRQYTPYFNDGDPCTFRCGASDCNIAFFDEEEEEEDDYGDESDFQSSYGSKNYENPERQAIFDAFGEALSIDDDIMLAVFGDHKKVTASREGFDVDDYDHE
jgi:hypothetical protein